MCAFSPSDASLSGTPWSLRLALGRTAVGSQAWPAHRVSDRWTPRTRCSSEWKKNRDGWAWSCITLLLSLCHCPFCDKLFCKCQRSCCLSDNLSVKSASRWLEYSESFNQLLFAISSKNLKPSGALKNWEENVILCPTPCVYFYWSFSLQHPSSCLFLAA